MKRHLPLVATAVALMLAVAGCGREQAAPEAAVASSLSLVSVSPALEEPLRVGDVVELRLEVEFVLGVAAGHVGFVVQTADGELLVENVHPVGRGEHSLSLHADFEVPLTDVIHVVVPISERGRATTSDVQILTYEVVAR